MTLEREDIKCRSAKNAVLKGLFGTKKEGENIYLNDDCNNWLPKLPDDFFSIAIIDCPYGISAGKRGDFGTDRMMNKSGTKTFEKQYYKKSDWDNKRPSKEYWHHLFRVSQNQIIFGANYFVDYINHPSMGWIVWDKNKSGNYSDGELIYTSFQRALKIFKFTWNGLLQGDMKNKERRIHVCQKPKQLYRWLCKNYAKPGDIILDSHVGSANSLAVYEELGFQYVAFEKDADYYRDSLENIKKHKAFFKSRKPDELTENTQLSIYDEI